ncbi:hypothetical protein DFH06DRAFT_1344710 [Mycena polygramma]|nr:hypothetical protein DFH06DRAFT_1344710 [Mycena polygramma]
MRHSGALHGPWLQKTVHPDHLPPSDAISLLSDPSTGLTPALAQQCVSTLRKLDSEAIEEFSQAHPGELGGLQDALGLFSLDPNDSVRMFIVMKITPVVALDRILATLKPDPTIPSLSRVPTRPPAPKAITEKLRKLTQWHASLKLSYDSHLAVLVARQRSKKPKNPADKAKGDFLAFLRKLGGTGKGGARVQHNIRHVAFLLGYYLRGGFDFGDTFIQYTLDHAKAIGVPLERSEVNDTVSRSHIKVYVTTMWVALAHSAVVLLRDDTTFTAKDCVVPPHYFKLWQASGNQIALEAEHPLNIVENCLWRLIIRVATQQITAADAIEQFYSDPRVLKVIKSEPELRHRNALEFAHDLLNASPPLLTISASGDRSEMDMDISASSPGGGMDFDFSASSPGSGMDFDAPASPAPLFPRLAEATPPPAKPAAATPPPAKPAATSPPAAATPPPPAKPAATSPPAAATPPPAKPAAATPASAKPAAVTPPPTKTAMANPKPGRAAAAPSDVPRSDDDDEDDEDDEDTIDATLRPVSPTTRPKKKIKAEMVPLAATTRTQAGKVIKPPSLFVSNPEPPRPKARNSVRAKPPSHTSPSAPSSKPREPQGPVQRLVLLCGADFNPDAPESEFQRIADARAKGKLSGNVHFKLYHPTLDPSQPPVCREFDWPVFENAPFDKTTAEEMIASQILVAGIPLHCLPSARDLDPTLRPSSQQSAVAVATRAQFEALSPQAQHELHRFRSVLILDSTNSQAEPEFNREFLETYRDVDQDCEIQDPGLRTLQTEDIVRIGPLSALLDHTARDGTVILNALQNPLPYSNIDLPPGWANHATHERAANHTPAQAELPPPLMPWEDLRWIIFAMRYAKSSAHQDVLSTVLKMLCGWKLWAIAVRADGAPDNEGDFSSRFAFRGWNPKLSNCGFLRYELLLLGPGMTLYLRAGTIHFVISLTDCAAAGLHSHCASSLSSGIWCSLHNVITDSATTNADHATARSLLVRIFIYQARQIVARKHQV